jgi:hypothetical protein
MKASVATIALTAAALCVLGTACSSSTSGKASAGGGSSAAAGASTGGNSAQSGASAAVTCKQLTYAQVQPLQTETITTVKVTPGAGAPNVSGQQCVFSGANDEGALDVLVLGGSGAKAAYQEDLQGESDGQVSVAGVGDMASRDKGDDQIIAFKGNVYCSVSLGSDEDVPGVAAIESANNGTSTLTEAQNNTIAEALGTVCNRIFGSGNTTPDLSSLAAAGGGSGSGAPGSGAPESGSGISGSGAPESGSAPAS